jgi:hypothetical protein
MSALTPPLIPLPDGAAPGGPPGGGTSMRRVGSSCTGRESRPEASGSPSVIMWRCEGGNAPPGS